ncbi:hypothetical protein DPMN_146085 [Dreissena polymorpha]|uniref:Uncharacterized protein n=1 Tax=Dreissena polymorpha TaxID=45954 RepID=A0A9D4J1N4_DREPO|nr:hypothetical protein DPMN_146085 [Dreissena polymorpha]
MVKWDLGVEGVIDMPEVAGVRICKGSFMFSLPDTLEQLAATSRTYRWVSN